MKHCRDIVVLGAGPAGTAVGTLLARRGFTVLVVDRDRHPRHHIGESLLPASIPILNELGISTAEMQRRYQPKFGARFYAPTLDRMSVFEFMGRPEDPAPAYQVLREEFDAMLADNARHSGCELWEDTEVSHIDVGEERDEPVITLANGDEVAARFVIDASGRGALLASRRKTKVMLPHLGRLAIYTYYRDLPPHDDQDQRYITMYLFDGGWFWFIPLRDGRMSVGVVLSARALETGVGAQGQFELAAGRLPRLAERLRHASPIEPFRAASDYSYKVNEKIGRYFALVGDAAGFLDPIFSSGVHLGLTSAHAAAKAVESRLKTGDQSALVSYAQHMQRGFGVFEAFVSRFYNRGLAENLLMATGSPPEMRRAVTHILAGFVWNRDNPVLKMIPEAVADAV